MHVDASPNVDNIILLTSATQPQQLSNFIDRAFQVEAVPSQSISYLPFSLQRRFGGVR